MLRSIRRSKFLLLIVTVLLFSSAMFLLHTITRHHLVEFVWYEDDVDVDQEQEQEEAVEEEDKHVEVLQKQEEEEEAVEKEENKMTSHFLPNFGMNISQPNNSYSFETGQPKLLVILAYQRSGSTFFGHLFNYNPDSFFIYEPLDSLYSSTYGTKHGWNVPTDITTYQNGSERILPEVELEKVPKFLNTLLSCDTGSLPTETLVHRFMHIIPEESSAMIPYVQCINKKKHKKIIEKYEASIPWKYCGQRFGEMSEARLNECRLMLSSGQYRKEHMHHKNMSLFMTYLKNAQELRRTVDKSCLPLLSIACKKRSLRVTKVVRATMESMRPLLEKNPNFRVIHLIRDPRAVVLSRKNFLSSGGLFTEVDRNGSMILEAFVYCRTVVKDIKSKLELERLFPGKIYTIIFEDMVRNFRTYAENVYRFIGQPMHKNVTSWIREIESNRTESVKIVGKWKGVLTFQEHLDIWNGCKEFFQLTNFDWDH